MDKAIDKRIPRGVIRRRIWGEYIKGADEPWIDQPHSRVRWYVAKKDEDREGTANFIYSARYFCSPVLHNSVLTHLWVCRSWKQDMASTHRENSCKQMVVILVAVAMTSSHQLIWRNQNLRHQAGFHCFSSEEQICRLQYRAGFKIRSLHFTYRLWKY